MAKYKADGTKKPMAEVRDLVLTDVAEGQMQTEVMHGLKCVLDSMVGMNPGMVCSEVITLAGGETSVDMKKNMASIVGVLGFNASGVSNALGITAVAIDGTDKKQVNLTGTVVAGKLLVLYVAL